MATCPTTYNPLTQAALVLEASKANNLPFVFSTTSDFTGYTPTAEIRNAQGGVLYSFTTTSTDDGQIVLTSTPWKITWTVSLAVRNALAIGTYKFQIQLTRGSSPTVPIAIVGDFEVIA
jgi:hypothetical protein